MFVLMYLGLDVSVEAVHVLLPSTCHGLAIFLSLR